MRCKDTAKSKNTGAKSPERSTPARNVLPFPSRVAPEPAPATNDEDPGPDSAA